jgi:GT2 family glycosyltransferase
MREDPRGASVGAVVIGRNEGERLARCLGSLARFEGPVVYVDSGSTDASPARAAELGVEVIAQTAPPFSAARARNEGFGHLRARHGDRLRYVQFVDGDCELDDRWIERAALFLDERPEVGVVCGRVRERHPERSLYNRLADMEWDGPLGEVASCGGNAMIRAAAFVAAGEFDAGLIAGEEAELHLRIRRAGYAIWRIDREMVRHDLAMERFGQWWRRSVRTGHAYAEGARLHGRGPERFRVREVASVVAWGGVLPLVSLALAPPSLGASLALLALGYGRLWRRSYGQERARRGAGDAALYAASCAVGKLAEMQGVAQHCWTRLVLGRESRPIEHKRAADPHSSRVSTLARFSRQSGKVAPSSASVRETSSTE